MSPQALRELGLHLVEEELSARRYAENSKKLIRASLREFLRWASRRGTVDLAAFGKKDLAAFLAWLGKRPSKKSGEPLSRGVRKSIFHAVSILFSCLYRAMAIPENPTDNFTHGFAEVKCWRRRPLTRDEVDRFLEQLDPSTKQGLRDRALFELIYSSGLRVAEAAGLKVGDVDLERRVMVVRGKFDRDRMVPLSEVARDFLGLYLGERTESKDSWVFPSAKKASHIASESISEHFRTLLRRFDMDYKDISTHSLRHSTATHLLENGASVRHVQELLGHKCIESTVRYTHVMVDGLAKVYRRYHPREHELFEAVDEEYEKRLDSFVAERPERG